MNNSLSPARSHMPLPEIFVISTEEMLFPRAFEVIIMYLNQVFDFFQLDPGKFMVFRQLNFGF